MNLEKEVFEYVIYQKTTVSFRHSQKIMAAILKAYYKCLYVSFARIAASLVSVGCLLTKSPQLIFTAVSMNLLVLTLTFFYKNETFLKLPHNYYDVADQLKKPLKYFWKPYKASKDKDNQRLMALGYMLRTDQIKDLVLPTFSELKTKFVATSYYQDRVVPIVTDKEILCFLSENSDERKVELEVFHKEYAKMLETPKEVDLKVESKVLATQAKLKLIREDS